MSLASALSNFQASIKEPQWLQFVGYALAVGGLLGHGHWFGLPLAYVGIFVSFAGFIYDRIYN